jgi:hypothetical protein
VRPRTVCRGRSPLRAQAQSPQVLIPTPYTSAFGCEAKLVLGQVRHQVRGGLLAFGAVVVAVWYASVAVRSLMTALNVVFGVQEDRPVQIRYPLSMLLAVGIALTRSRPAPATCRPRRRGLWQNAEVAARVSLY